MRQICTHPSGIQLAVRAGVDVDELLFRAAIHRDSAGCRPAHAEYAAYLSMAGGDTGAQQLRQMWAEVGAHFTQVAEQLTIVFRQLVHSFEQVIPLIPQLRRQQQQLAQLERRGWTDPALRIDMLGLRRSRIKGGTRWTQIKGL